MHFLVVDDVTVADTPEGPVHKSDARLRVISQEGETAMDKTQSAGSRMSLSSQTAMDKTQSVGSRMSLSS